MLPHSHSPNVFPIKSIWASFIFIYLFIGFGVPTIYPNKPKGTVGPSNWRDKPTYRKNGIFSPTLGSPWIIQSLFSLSLLVIQLVPPRKWKGHALYKRHKCIAHRKEKTVPSKRRENYKLWVLFLYMHISWLRSPSWSPSSVEPSLWVLKVKSSVGWAMSVWLHSYVGKSTTFPFIFFDFVFTWGLNIIYRHWLLLPNFFGF